MNNKLNLSPRSTQNNSNSSMIKDSKIRKSPDTIFRKKSKCVYHKIAIKKDITGKENKNRLSLEYTNSINQKSNNII